MTHRGEEAKGNAEEAWIRSRRRIFLGSSRHSSVFSGLLADPAALRIGSGESEQQQVIRLTPTRSTSKLTFLRFLKSKTLLPGRGGRWRPTRLSLKSNWAAKPVELAAIYGDENAILEKNLIESRREMFLLLYCAQYIIYQREIRRKRGVYGEGDFYTSFASRFFVSRFSVTFTARRIILFNSSEKKKFNNSGKQRIRMGQWERRSGFRGRIYASGTFDGCGGEDGKTSRADSERERKTRRWCGMRSVAPNPGI